MDGTSFSETTEIILKEFPGGGNSFPLPEKEEKAAWHGQSHMGFGVRHT